MAMSLGTKVLNTVVLTLKQRNNIHGNVCGHKGLKHSRSHFKTA
jgi:hypothetical protein